MCLAYFILGLCFPLSIFVFVFLCFFFFVSAKRLFLSLAPSVYVLPLNFFSLLYSVWTSLIRFRLLRQDHRRTK